MHDIALTLAVILGFSAALIPVAIGIWRSRRK